MSYESVENFKPAPMGWNVATATTNMPNVKGYLIAWDPVNQTEVWRANYLGPWNGGVLTTAGNLVVQGNAAGDVTAYRADSGEKLWSMFAQSPVMAAPATYEINGEQYIAVLSGWGGAYPFLQGIQSDRSGNERNISRVLVFKLGGNSNLPPLAAEAKLVIDPPPATADAATVASGEALYGRFCSVCHGEAAVAGGVVPDLRGSPFIAVDAWYSVVLDGALKGRRHGRIWVGARPYAGRGDPRLYHPSRQRGRRGAERKGTAPARSGPRRGYRGAGHGLWRPGLRTMPCLLRRLG
jgi:quinohemoprotein ethanol dehydrogenase